MLNQDILLGLLADPDGTVDLVAVCCSPDPKEMAQAAIARAGLAAKADDWGAWSREWSDADDWSAAEAIVPKRQQILID